MNVRSIVLFVLATIICSSLAHAEEAPVAAAPAPIEPLPRADREPASDPVPAPNAATVTDVATPVVVPAVAAAPAPAPEASSVTARTSEPTVSTAPLPPVSSPSLPAAGGPVAVVSLSAPRPAPRRLRMGWFGVGARLGVSDLRLAPSQSLVGKLNQASGGTFAPSDFAVASSAQTFTPTLHFGGSGYFFKLDLPFSFAPEFTTVGLGLYPINVGVLIEQAALFPYVSLGGAASAVKSRTTADPGTSNKIIGAIVQARAAVGLKYFPVRGLALSAEAGYSPWTAGLMVLPATAAPGAGGNNQKRMQGGTGSILDFALGAEWL